jgi:hypothetical protein
MNKKLAWIEVTPNDLDTWKQYYSLSASSKSTYVACLNGSLL